MRLDILRCYGDDNDNFNPRTREGCDDIAVQHGYTGTEISIHAPVKGATRCRVLYNGMRVKISIHAPVKGATVAEQLQTNLADTFQSTHP